MGPPLPAHSACVLPPSQHGICERPTQTYLSQDQPGFIALSLKSLQGYRPCRYFFLLSDSFSGLRSGTSKIRAPSLAQVSLDFSKTEGRVLCLHILSALRSVFKACSAQSKYPSLILEDKFNCNCSWSGLVFVRVRQQQHENSNARQGKPVEEGTNALSDVAKKMKLQASPHAIALLSQTQTCKGIALPSSARRSLP